MINGITVILFILLCASMGVSIYFYILYKKMHDHTISFVNRINSDHDDNIIASQTRGYVEATKNLVRWGFL